jgi:hypothetical protein
MKRALKVVYVVLAGIVVLVIAGVIAVGLFADRALEAAIETAGTKALNVTVSVEDVDLSILGGRLGFANLAINNPPGYEHDRLLELGDAKITVQTGSLLTDMVNIRDIKLDRVNVVLEQRGVTGNNIQDVIKAMPAKGGQESEPSRKKLHIDNLEITNAAVKVKLLPVPGSADTLTLNLAPIKMTDLGADNDLDTVALSRQVLLAIVGGITEQGGDVLPKDMLNSLASELKNVAALRKVLVTEGRKALEAGKDVGTKVLGGGKELGKEVTEGAQDVRKGITEGLKGLLKRKKEQQQ